MKTIVFSLFLAFGLWNACSASHPSSLSENSVDVITGIYRETNTDITVSGPLPFTLKREFDPSAAASGYSLAGGWTWKILQPAPQLPGAGCRLHICSAANSANELESVKVLTGCGSEAISCIRFEKMGPWLKLSTHDGQEWKLLIENEKLKKVAASGGEEISYDYSGGQISCRSTANGHQLINEFYHPGVNELDGKTIVIKNPKDPRIGKVSVQKTLTDIEKEPITIASYDYFQGYTIMTDVLGMKKIYRFSKEQNRVEAIEVYDNQTLVRKEQYVWIPGPGGEPLLSFHEILDPSGKILKSEHYEYDDQGRMVKETVSGNLSGESSACESYSRQRIYSEEGLLTRETEDNGLYKTYKYDPQTLLLIESEIGQGQEPYVNTRYEYNSKGILIKTEQIDQRSEAGDKKTTLITPSDATHASGLAALVEEIIENSNGLLFCRTTLNAYTNRGQISRQEIFDAEAATKKILRKEYDEAGREIYRSDTSGGDILTAYFPLENIICSTDMQTGEITESRYNFQKRVTNRKITKADGTTLEQTNFYDALGHLVVSRDVLGNETSFVYDSLGRMIKKTDPPVMDENERQVNYQSSYLYNALDQMVSFTDPNGETTLFHYTARNKPYLIEYPDGSTDKFIYSLDGSLRTHKSRDGNTTIYERDGLGRVVETRVLSKENEFIECKSASYQGWSSVKTTDTSGKSRTFEAAKDKESSLKPALKTEKKAVRQSLDIGERLNYDYKNERGQRALQKIIVQPNGSMTITTFDALGRIEKIEIKDPFGTLLAKKECRYDGIGNIVRQTDTDVQNGSVIETRMVYGPGGRLKEKIEDAHTLSPRIFSYEYNEFGKMTKIVKPDGVVLVYDYHPSGDLQRIVSSDGTVDAEYFYDSDHRVIHAIDHVACAATIREYDDDGRMIREVLANGLSVSNTYDEEGRRIQMLLPDGSGALYKYKGKKLEAVKRLDPSGKICYRHKYEKYNEQGFLEEAKLIGEGGTLSISRNGDNRVEKLSSPFVKQKIAYESGKLMQVSTNHAPFDKKLKSYAYNSLGQLIQDGEDTLLYDSVDNLLVKGSQIFEVNDHNQVVKSGEAAYTYDQNGNLIFKKANGSHTAYSYDALDRLTEVRTEDKTIVYVYDPFHRCLSRQGAGEDPVHFLFDGDNEIGQADAALQIRQFRLLGLSHGAEIGAAVAIEIDGRAYTPIHDHRGSVISLIDAKKGKIKEIYEYDAYGRETIFDKKGREIQPEDSINPWRFSSKRVDPDTGLIHFGKREYDPSLYRWISQDPLGFFDGVNRYAFARCNPMQNVDLYGLFSVSSIWETINSAAKYINTRVTDCMNNCLEALNPVETLYRYLKELGSFFVGNNYLVLAGLSTSNSHTGVYGGGFEPHEKYRITFINGILTDASYLEANLALISESHGGCNVHYCHVGTKGWTCDLIRSVFSKFGNKTAEAKALAKIWRDLIQDMGGVDGGGIIFHYAHSLGGTETFHAKYLLSPEEQKMIRVITMGSPTLIPDDGFHSVVNIISCRDFISIFDPITFIYSILFGGNNVFFVGSHWDGIPGGDHFFKSYWEHWKEHFWQEYQEMIKELFQ